MKRPSAAPPTPARRSRADPRAEGARPEQESESGAAPPRREAVRRKEWAHLGSNQGPPACEAGALPLSYAPGSQENSGFAASRCEPEGSRCQ
jgi:hypothetical protein